MSQRKCEPDRERNIRLFSHLESDLHDAYCALSDARYYAEKLGMNELANRLRSHLEEVMRAAHGGYDHDVWEKYEVKDDERAVRDMRRQHQGDLQGEGQGAPVPPALQGMPWVQAHEEQRRGEGRMTENREAEYRRVWKHIAEATRSMGLATHALKELGDADLADRLDDAWTIASNVCEKVDERCWKEAVKGMEEDG